MRLQRMLLATAALACLLCLAAAPPDRLTTEQQTLLKQRDQERQRADLRLAKGDFGGAVKHGTEALRLTRAARGKDHAEVADLLDVLADWCELAGEMDAAVKHRKEALPLWESLFGKDDWRAADRRQELSQTRGMASLDAAGRAEVVAALRALRKARALSAKPKEAERLLVQALKTLHERLGRESLHAATALHDLGIARYTLQDKGGAKAAWREAVAIRRKTLPPGHPLIADSLYNLGVAQHDLGELKEARKNFEDALAIRRKALPPGHPHIAQSLNNLGIVQWRLGDLKEARKSHEEALAIFRKSLSPGHPDIALSLSNLGVVLHDLGEVKEARKNYEEALAILQKALPAGHHLIADSLSNLGAVQADLGEVKEARKSHEEALAIRRKSLPPGHPDIAVSLNNLGLVQRDLGEVKEARKNFEEALALFRKALPQGHPDIANSLNSLGIVQSDLREHKEARKSHEEALAIRRKVFPEGHPLIASSLNNLGVAQHDLGELKEARKNFEDALAIRRKAFPEGHPYTAESLNCLGIVQSDLREHKEARKNFEEALAIFRKALPQGHPLIALSLRNLGALAVVGGESAEGAFANLKEAVAISRRHLARMSLAQAETEQLHAAAGARSSLDLFLSLAAASRKDRADEAFGLALSLKGAVTTRQRWARQTRDARDEKTLALLDRLKQANLDVLRLSFSEHAPDAKGRRNDAEELRAAGKRRDRLEQELADLSPAFARLLDNQPVAPKDVRAALPADTALIDFLDYFHVSPPPKGKTDPVWERRTLAFVLRPGKEDAVMVPLGRTEELAKLVVGWRASHGSGKAPPKGSLDPALELRQRLWLPLEGHLGSETRVVLYSPDGALNGLPLAALPGPKKGTFLIHERAFVVVPVPALLPEVLAAKPARSDAEPTLLLAGGIDFGEGERPAPKGGSRLPALPRFKQLPGTESEVNDLQALFRKMFRKAAAPVVLSEAEATKAAFLAEAPRADFLHLATHGFFAPQSEVSALEGVRRSGLLGRLDQRLQGRHPGLLSGVVFAGVNDPGKAPEDALLTALEASDLRLDRARLVVLSACETGLGKVAGGEGVLGLQRAFQLAGARSVVASLWRVPDEQTHQLMREMYRRVWSKKPPSKAEALRQAQLWMLDNHKRSGLELKADKSAPVSPYFWAAFVLSGDWR